MRVEKSKEIEGITFTVQQLGGKRAMRLWTKLFRIVAPALAKTLEGNSLTGMTLAKLDLKSLGDAVQLLTDKLTPDEFDAMRDELFETAFAVWEGQTVPLNRMQDEIFAGRVLLAFKVLRFALEVNYGDFLGGLLGAMPAAASKSPA